MFQRLQPDMNMTIREPRQRNTPSTCITNTAGKAAITRGSTRRKSWNWYGHGSRRPIRDTSSPSDGRIATHPYPVDESGFRGVHQRVRKSSRRCQPPSYPFRQILDGQGKEVMMNICDFIMSYNFDDSDPMTDYFHTNFYLTLGIGSYKQPYKVEPPKLGSKDKPEVFKHPEGPAHKAMRRALGKARFGFIESRKYAGEIILGEDCFGSRGELSIFGRRNIQAQKWPKNASTNWRKPE